VRRASISASARQTLAPDDLLPSGGSGPSTPASAGACGCRRSAAATRSVRTGRVCAARWSLRSHPRGRSSDRPPRPRALRGRVGRERTPAHRLAVDHAPLVVARLVVGENTLPTSSRRLPTRSSRRRSSDAAGRCGGRHRGRRRSAPWSRPAGRDGDVLLALAEPVGPISREETRAGCAGSTITPHNHDEMSAKTCSGYGTLAG
jgi:hypothetical protein